MSKVKLHYLPMLAPSGKSALECMQDLQNELRNSGSYIDYELVRETDGEMYFYMEERGAKVIWPLWLDIVPEREEPVEEIFPPTAPAFAEVIAISDPIAPDRIMPTNYDPFDMASVLVKDATLARTVSSDVVQRLAAELLKYKPKEE